MGRSILLDTGVLVAVSNPADPDHSRCVEAWKSIRSEPVSVEGVLVEAAHLLRRNGTIQRTAVELALTIGIRFAPATGDHLRRAVKLMDRYRDVPMDFVAACLVAVAETEQIPEVLTLDRRGFRTYRLGKRRFRIFPD